MLVTQCFRESSIKCLIITQSIISHRIQFLINEYVLGLISSTFRGRSYLRQFASLILHEVVSALLITRTHVSYLRNSGSAFGLRGKMSEEKKMRQVLNHKLFLFQLDVLLKRTFYFEGSSACVLPPHLLLVRAVLSVVDQSLRFTFFSNNLQCNFEIV